MPITETKGGWKIRNTPGTSKSKKKAKQRLRAIKWQQGKRHAKRRRNQ